MFNCSIQRPQVLLDSLRRLAAVAFCTLVLVGCNSLRSIGKETAEVLDSALDRSTRNIQATVNQFGQLVADVNGSDTKKAAEARRILESVLQATSPKPDAALAATIVVSNLVATDNLTADIWFLVDNDPLIVRALARQKAHHFKPEPLAAATPAPTTTDQIRRRVAEAANQYFGSSSFVDSVLESPAGAQCASALQVRGQACGPWQYTDGRRNCSPAFMECVRKAQSEALTNAILSTFTAGATYAPGANSMTRTMSKAKFAVVLMPCKELTRVKDRAQIDFFMHFTNDTTKGIGVFSERPLRLHTSTMLDRIAQTEDDTLGNLCYDIVNLRLDPIMVKP